MICRLEGEIVMSRVDMLRDKLHKVIDKGTKREIIKISMELDVEILKYINIVSIINKQQINQGKEM